MSVRPTYYDRNRYTLLHKESGSKVIREPIGWKNEQLEFLRNKTYDGILTKISGELKFTGDGKKYIENVDNLYGINADIRILKDEKHPVTDEYTRVWDGGFDLSTMVVENEVLTIKIDTSGLEQILKARQSEKYELERLETLSGEVLPPLKIDRLVYDGRKIFLSSFLEVLEADRKNVAFRMQFRAPGNDPDDRRTGFLTVPTTIKYQSDIRVHTPFKELFTTTDEFVSDTGYMFYLEADKDRLLNVKINFSCTIQLITLNELSGGFFKIVLSTYENGTDFDLKLRTDLYVDPSISNIDGRLVNFTYEQNITLLKDESLALEFFGGADSWGTSFKDGDLNLDFEDVVATISIEEDSFFEPTTGNIVLPYEAMDRMMNIITDRTDAFYSEALGRKDIGYPDNGINTGALNGLTHGHWKRGFTEGLTDPNNLYSPFTTSIKDFMESFSACWNLGLGIERIGFQERVRIEEKEYFYNRNITIRLGKEINGKFEYIQVNNVKRSKDTTIYMSEIEIGSEKGGDYEEVQGLDEYNAKSTFSTVINRIEKAIKFISKYRRDGMGAEIARRKQLEFFPTVDTPYDKDVFIEDLKEGTNGVYQQRKWQDDLAVEPTGIYDPDSATNLRLSQFNMLIRKGWVITAGLTKYLNDYVRFGSSTGNSKLKTQLTGQPEYAENGNIKNSDLERARYVGEKIEFEYQVDFNLIQAIQGETVILGNKIPNFYGLVAFKNEKGQIEKGWIQSVKPEGVGSWELILANNLN